MVEGKKDSERHCGGKTVHGADFPEFPPNCRVILYNDGHTPKDFVVSVLDSVFEKGQEEAVKMTDFVQENGAAVIGIYTYDIAVSLANYASERARKRGFPLHIEVVKA